LQFSLDGLRINHNTLDGKVSGLEQTAEKFRSYVEATFVSGEKFNAYASEVTQTSKDLILKFDALDQYKNETNAHLKSGLLYTTSDGIPVYGIEIGQNNTVDGIETFDKFARFTSDRLSFYDANDTEVAYISDYKLVITHAVVLGNLKVGGFILDTTNGLSLRWEG
jgi:hypothetical protein